MDEKGLPPSDVRAGKDLKWSLSLGFAPFFIISNLTLILKLRPERTKLNIKERMKRMTFYA